MRLARLLCVALVAMLPVGSARPQRRDTNFPTDDEIRLVLTQAERGINEYKPLLDSEEKMFGTAGAEAVAKDREIVRGIDTAIVGFRKNPQAFNGPLGFAFFEWLDDASRNALLSSVSATNNNVTEGLINGDKEKMQTNLELAKDFSNVSTVFYTVSENAGALYARYVNGEEQLAKQGVKLATDCTAILKKRQEGGPTP